MIEKLRLQLLVPITVVTCPILAVENGVDAQAVALNVMAVLFVFDFDDGVFSTLFTARQQVRHETRP